MSSSILAHRLTGQLPPAAAIATKISMTPGMLRAIEQAPKSARSRPLQRDQLFDHGPSFMRGAQWRVAGQSPSWDRPTRGTLLCHGWCPPSSQPRLRQRFRMWRERQFRRLRRLPCAEYQRDSRRTGSLRGARHRLRLRRALRCMPSRERGRVSRHSGRGRRPAQLATPKRAFSESSIGTLVPSDVWATPRRA